MKPHELLLSIGFSEPTPVDTLRSIAHLFGSSKRKRCGIYALLLPNDTVYIGQAKDVVTRFAAHRRVHSIIDGFAFVAEKPSALDRRERELIFAAERAGIRLSNVVHATDMHGESDLEAVVPGEELDRWIEDPFTVNGSDIGQPRIRLPKTQVERYRRNFDRLVGFGDLGGAVVLYLTVYLRGCIPFPRTTEYSFWSVSCMPQTKNSPFPRMLCVSAGVMELFVVGYRREEKPPVHLWAFVNVARDVLVSEFGSEKQFGRQHPHVTILDATYRDAGQHQARLLLNIAQQGAHDLLADPRLHRAAGTLALRVMRKRATIYSKYHCQLLADMAFDYGEMLDISH